MSQLEYSTHFSIVQVSKIRRFDFFLEFLNDKILIQIVKNNSSISSVWINIDILRIQITIQKNLQH